MERYLFSPVCTMSSRISRLTAMEGGLGLPSQPQQPSLWPSQASFAAPFCSESNGSWNQELADHPGKVLSAGDFHPTKPFCLPSSALLCSHKTSYKFSAMAHVSSRCTKLR